jgi:hypothetical protein
MKCLIVGCEVLDCWVIKAQEWLLYLWEREL